LKLNPDFGAAYTKLALRESNLSTALDLATKAKDLEPSRAGYFLLTAEILRRMGKNAEAAERAKFVADRWWTTDRDEAMELWNKVPAADRSGLELISDGENRDDHENTQLAEGNIKSVDCDEQKANSVTLEQPGGPLSLQVKRSILGFTDTFWYGAEHFTVCHHVNGRYAVVRYRAGKDNSRPAEIVELDVRDDWFTSPAQKSPSTALTFAQ
jgi:hypothetical protein